MSIETVDAFAKRLFEIGCRKIYLIHYDNEEKLARQIAKTLMVNGIEGTVAVDARKLGRDFVSQCISRSDLSIVINPQADAEQLIFHIGQITYSLKW